MPSLNVEIGQADELKMDLADKAEAVCSQGSIPSPPPNTYNTTAPPTAGYETPPPTAGNQYPDCPSDVLEKFSGLLKDGKCDYQTNLQECGWDGTDCMEQNKFVNERYPECYPAAGQFIAVVGDGKCDTPTNIQECQFDGGDCAESNKIMQARYPECQRLQYSALLGDGKCDQVLNVEQCGYDDNDCKG